MNRLIAGLLVALTAGAAAPAPSEAAAKPVVELWRLDCGEFVAKHADALFSDTFQYPAGPKRLVDSCYLIRHGNEYVLWDTGLTDALIGHSYDDAEYTLHVKRSIVDQLAQLGLKPQQIGTVALSHWHFDHLGQAPRFPHARLLIGKEDLEVLRRSPPPDKDSAKALEHWLNGNGKLDPVTGDRDVFGDGKVVMLYLPGHTPGHHALLVRLASGLVLISGDQYHFTEQVANRGVPSFNADRADTLASMDRFDRIAKNVGAKIVIQHEPADVAKLPRFPASAE
jgi:N-acyl homoserine lactone hydrolase